MARDLSVSLDELPLDGKKQVEDGATKALFIRDRDGVRAFQATCPHYGAPLVKGEICGGKLYCPWHKAVFAIGDGALIEPPAMKGLDRYPVRIENGFAIATLEPIVRQVPRVLGDKTFVLVGTGAAAVAAATTLRREGFAGRIIMIGREEVAPYDRCKLSKNFLAKKTPPEAMVLEGDFYAAHGVEFRLGDVVHVDPGARRVTLADGEVVAGDALMIATGSRAVVPDIAGSTLPGVHSLRSLADADAISTAAEGAKHVVVAGGGFIGLEAAAFLTKRGLEATVISRDALPLAARFGDEVAVALKRFHEGNGVRFVEGTIARLEGGDKLSAALLEDGRSFPADLVLIAAGAAPETGAFHGVALRDDGGIEVDETLALAPDVYLAGDIAAFREEAGGSKVRIEHWRLAEQHGMHVARAMLGRAEPFARAPFFWSNQGDKRLDYAGFAKDWSRIVLRGDPATLSFIAYYIKDERAVAACSIGRDSEFTAFLRLIGEGRFPSAEAIEAETESSRRA